MRTTHTVLALAALSLASAGHPRLSYAAIPNGGWDAAWSPDGATIAFTSGSPHSIPNLWLIGPDKSGLKQMTTRGAHAPHWLPDGKTIVFGTLRDGDSAYMAIDADAKQGSEKPYEALPAGAVEPVWSPDGSLALYGNVSMDGRSRDLAFARTGGGGATMLTTKFWCRDWSWAPDGNRIVFVVGKATGTSVWTADVATKDLRLLYKGFCSAPAYSPDGKQLAIAVPDVRSGFAILLLGLSPRAEKRIAVTSFDGKKITWSTDGSRMFFASSRKGEPAMWSTSTDGKVETRITPDGMSASAPALSANGERIAYQASLLNAYSPELYVRGASGEAPRHLTSSAPSFWSPIWSPDGKEFAFQSDVNHTAGLFVGSSAGRLGKSLAQISGADPAEASWFPNGKALLLGDAGRLLIVSKSGGKDAVKPLPKLASIVQGARLTGDEVVVTEWSTLDATLSAFNLDGSGRRALTRKVEEPRTSEKGLDSPKGPIHDSASSPAHASAAGSAFAEHAVQQGDGPAPPAAPEVGNPHASLGLVGPQENTAKPERPAVIDLFPTVSPDRKVVAFSRNGQVWLVGFDGKGERQITSQTPSQGSVRTVSSLAWSPGGASLLFLAFNTAASRLTLEIWTCGVDAGSEHLLYSESVNTEYGVFYSACTYPPVYIAGGKRILFTSLAGGEPHVVTIASDGTDLREMAPAPSSFPALDPNESKLAYVDLSDFHERIRILDIASGKRSAPLFRK